MAGDWWWPGAQGFDFTGSVKKIAHSDHCRDMLVRYA